jgi:signal transduction histidine kinase/ligand-binding sensor domain-containing protein
LLKLRTYFTIIIWLHCLTMFGQSISYFENITTKNGLPSNYVFCTAIDKNGYVWAGTDKGICKFNGETWQTWDMDNGLPGNYISKIITCKTGGLWLGIAEKGIYHIDENVTEIIPQNSTGSAPTDINIDKKGIVHFIKVINDSMNECIALNWEKHKIICTTTINKVVHENEIVSGNHIFVNDSYQKNQLLKNKNIQTHYIEDKNNFNKAKIVSNYFINNNIILQFIDGQKETILWQTKKVLSKYNDVVSIGNIVYAGISGEGLFEMNGNQIKIYNQKNGLGNLTVNQLMVDSSRNLYINTLGGGIFILPNKNKIVLANTDKQIREFSTLHKETYFIENDCFAKMDSNFQIKRYALDSEPLCFFVDDNIVYIGNFKGITKYKIGTNHLEKMQQNPLTAGISSIIKKGNDIFYSTYGAGFTKLKNYKSQTIINEKMPFVNIEKLYNVQDGFIALSHEAGAYYCDISQSKYKAYSKQNGLLHNYCTSIFERNDTIIIGSKNGITILKNKKIIQIINNKNGFVGKVVKEILATNQEKIFVISENAIHLFENNTLQTIGNDVLRLNTNELIISVAYQKQNNSFLISTTNRFLSIPIQHLQKAIKPKVPEIFRAQLGNQMVQDVKKFDVDFDNKNISFQLFPSEANLISSLKNYYRINKTEWIEIGKNGIFNLQQFRSDQYEVFVKSINADGVESEEKLVATFTIQKPWWLQWWFIALSILLLSILIWQVLKIINQRKQQQADLQQQKLEQERQRISRDLHDNMGAFTSALIANVQQLKSKIGDNAEVTKMQSNAEQILSSLRETIWVLKNKEILIVDFSEGFKNYMFKILKSFEDIDFVAEENVAQNILLPTTLAVHLNKIMQESIQNIIKHANASKIIYSIKSTNVVEITIQDNGKGFDVNTNNAGNGLENMQWRADEAHLQYTIESKQSIGTTITIIYDSNKKYPN